MPYKTRKWSSSDFTTDEIIFIQDLVIAANNDADNVLLKEQAVESIVAGSYIEVDDTDATNPIVSAINLEPALGNPPVSGYVLASTVDGVRSWASAASGGSGFTGTEGSIPFVGADGSLTEDNADLFWDNTNKQMRVGAVATPIDESSLDPIVFKGDVDDYISITGYNRNSGTSASCDLTLANDQDDGTVENGTYVNVGIVSSTYAVEGDEFIEPNDSYLGAYNGNLAIQANSVGKKIAFTTGGAALDNVRVEINDSQTTIYANKDTEIIPALEAANWTATNGFSAGSGEITCVNDIDDSTIQPNPALSITAGKTYEVIIVCSAETGTVDYSLGGVSGTTITATTIDEYITATTTGNFIITATAGATCTITSISIRELVANTGNLFVEGNITLGSKLQTTTGAGILSANGEGIATFDSIPLLPASDPTTANQAVRKAYVDTFAQGLIPIANCRVATTENGTLATAFEAGDTIDGIELAENDRILIKNQTAQEDNGIYVVQASGAPVRATDYDEDAEVIRGTYTYITEGTANEKTQWVMYSDAPEVGVDPILFTFQPGITVNFVNLGTGKGVFYQQDGLDIELKSINVSGDLSVSASNDEITIAGPTWVKETPTGDIDGANKTYTLTSTPVSNSLDLVLNTRVLTEDVDYTLSTATITMANAISANYSALPFIAKYQTL